MKIYQGTDSELTCGDSTNPGTINYNQSIVTPATNNLYWPVIPFEMLKTYEVEPQVIVTVGDLPAVCHNMTCNWNYTIPIGEVSAFTYDDASR